MANKGFLLVTMDAPPAFEEGDNTDFLGFVEQRAPGASSLDLNAFGPHAAAIDLVNTYAPYC